MAESSKPRQSNAEASLIGANIRERRVASRRSLASFARDVGVASPTAHGWEAGLYMPRPTVLRKIASVLDCSVDELLAESHPAAEVA